MNVLYMEGLIVPAAQQGHLTALKILARDDEHRPQDLADLRALLKRVSSEDLRLARSALETITTRGFHRGRALISDLEALLG